MSEQREIKVRLFGPQARLAGAEEATVSLPPSATVNDLLAELGERFAPLRPSLSASRIAIDHAYAAGGDPIPAGAEVALIGLVSGG